jgi:microcystin-dependent protein
MFGFNFAPDGWALCNGMLLPINQNTALFSLLGTTYGGDGRSTFALPNLQGRVPIHQGNGAGLSPYVIGQIGGSEDTTLTVDELPAHSHSVKADNGVGKFARPAANFPARSSDEAYAAASDGTTMNPGMIADTGSGQPFSNIQPYLVVSFCIALAGIYPSRN